MKAEFLVTTTSHIDREFKKLASKHESLLEIFRSVIETLKSDPYNRNGPHPIKKLTAVSEDQGLYRIRSGRFLFRPSVPT